MSPRVVTASVLAQNAIGATFGAGQESETLISIRFCAFAIMPSFVFGGDARFRAGPRLYAPFRLTNI